MPTIDTQTGTRIDEVSSGIYRISTPLPEQLAPPGGFCFNQYLVVDDAPLLFHTGPRGVFELTKRAIEHVLPLDRLAYVAFSHFESDECGALNHFLAAAPRAQPLVGRINAMINADGFDRPPRALGDAERVSLGTRTVRWLDAPHLPHGWENGFLFEEHTSTLFCGDLFTQGGGRADPLTTQDILGPSEAFRREMDYFAHRPGTGAQLEQLAALEPKTLACMHGSAFEGDGAAPLRDLAAALQQ